MSTRYTITAEGPTAGHAGPVDGNPEPDITGARARFVWNVDRPDVGPAVRRFAMQTAAELGEGWTVTITTEQAVRPYRLEWAEAIRTRRQLFGEVTA